MSDFLMLCISILIVATAIGLRYAALVALDASTRSVEHLRELVRQAIQAAAHKQEQ